MSDSDKQAATAATGPGPDHPPAASYVDHMSGDLGRAGARERTAREWRATFQAEGRLARRKGQGVEHCPAFPDLPGAGDKFAGVSHGREWMNGWRLQDALEQEATRVLTAWVRNMDEDPTAEPRPDDLCTIDLAVEAYLMGRERGQALLRTPAGPGIAEVVPHVVLVEPEYANRHGAAALQGIADRHLAVVVVIPTPSNPRIPNYHGTRAYWPSNPEFALAAPLASGGLVEQPTPQMPFGSSECRVTVPEGGFPNEDWRTRTRASHDRTVEDCRARFEASPFRGYPADDLERGIEAAAPDRPRGNLKPISGDDALADPELVGFLVGGRGPVDDRPMPDECVVCHGRTFVAVDQPSLESGFEPGPNRRCVSCKSLFGPTLTGGWRRIVEGEESTNPVAPIREAAERLAEETGLEVDHASFDAAERELEADGYQTVVPDVATPAPERSTGEDEQEDQDDGK